MAQLRAAQRWKSPSQPLGGLLRKRFEQQRNVFTPLAQGRQAQLSDVQAIRQVLAKTPGPCLVQQIRLGRGDDPQIHANALIGAQSLKLLLLQHPQQFHLLGQGHAFDFIEKQRAAIGVFKLADTFTRGAGERAALMAEQFRLEQLLGNRRAIERHERFVRARPEVVQAAGDQLFAAAGFTTDQYVDRQRRQIQHLSAQRLQTTGHAQQRRVEFGAVVGQLMQGAVFQHQPALVQRPAQAAQQGFRAKGFFQKVVGAIAHGVDRHRHIAVAGQQNHRQVGITTLNLGQQLKAGHAGHAHVAEDHAREVPRQLRQALIGAAEQLHLETRQAQPLLDGAANAAFVVDHHHGIQHGLWASRSMGKVTVNTAPLA